MEPMIVSLLKFMLNGSVRGLASVQLSMYPHLDFEVCRAVRNEFLLILLEQPPELRQFCFKIYQGIKKKKNIPLIISTWPEGTSNYSNQVG